MIAEMETHPQGEISSETEVTFIQGDKPNISPRTIARSMLLSPIAFKFTPLFLPDTCLNQYLPLQVASRMCWCSPHSASQIH